MRKPTKFVAALAILSLTASACGDSGDETTTTETAETATTAADNAASSVTEDPETAVSAATVVEAASGKTELSLFVAAVEAAGLTEALEGEGPFTVFAPNDEAFENILFDQVDGFDTLDELLADEDALKDILNAHVVPGNYGDEEIREEDGNDLPTLNDDSPATITVQGSTPLVNSIGIISVDLTADNGVIHTIDQVIVPGA